MTKLKSKKMTKSTLAIIIMGIAIVALLAFGGSFAYFTATATAPSTQTLTAATISIGSSTPTLSFSVGNSAAVLPGDSVTLNFNVNNASTRKSYVFVQFTLGGTSNLTLNILDNNNLPQDWHAATLTGIGADLENSIAGDSYSNVFYYIANASNAEQNPTTTVTWASTAVIDEAIDSNTADGEVGGNQTKTITISAKVAATQYAETTTTAGVETAFSVADAFALVASNFTAD